MHFVLYYRKRAAAKQLIEAYYFQLTDGCGNTDCGNTFCASCPNFSYKHEDRNKLAVTSIALFKQKAQLCQNERNKVARLPDSTADSTTPTPVLAAAVSPLTSPSSSAAPIPGPSSAKSSSSGATPKSTASSPTGE